MNSLGVQSNKDKKKCGVSLQSILGRKKNSEFFYKNINIFVNVLNIFNILYVYNRKIFFVIVSLLV